METASLTDLGYGSTILYYAGPPEEKPSGHDRMKTLYILRHGKSSWDEPDLPDHDRPLAPRGRRAAALVGRHLKDKGVKLDLILCSTARRAVDTLHLVLDELGGDVTVERERGLYLCGAKVLLERLRDTPDESQHLMLVAHNPDLHELATLMVGEGDEAARAAMAEKFPTGACAAVLFGVTRWRDLEPGSGRLIDYAQPRRLA